MNKSVAVIIAALAGGCDVDFVSESGRIGFDAPQLQTYDARFVSGGAIAAGSRVCPFFDGWYEPDLETYNEGDEDDDAALRGCFAQSIDGPGRIDGECIVLDEPGEVVWSLDPSQTTCDEGIALPPDRVVFRSVALDGLRTEERHVLEHLALERGQPVAGSEYPADWIVPGGETIAVAAGVPVELAFGLRETATDEVVAWAGGSLEVSTGTVSGADALFGESGARILLAAGELAEVSIAIGDATSPALELEGVDVDTLGQLEIVPSFGIATELGMGDWWLRAMARDPEGRPVRGVPVQWRVVEGDDPIVPLLGEANPDYAALDTPCRAADEPEVERHATVEATLGDQVAVVELAWIPSLCDEPEPVDDGGLDGDGDGGGDGDDALGCACTSTRGGPDGPLGLLALGVLLGALRRRAARSGSIAP